MRGGGRYRQRLHWYAPSSTCSAAAMKNLHGLKAHDLLGTGGLSRAHSCSRGGQEAVVAVGQAVEEGAEVAEAGVGYHSRGKGKHLHTSREEGEEKEG